MTRPRNFSEPAVCADRNPSVDGAAVAVDRPSRTRTSTSTGMTIVRLMSCAAMPPKIGPSSMKGLRPNRSDNAPKIGAPMSSGVRRMSLPPAKPDPRYVRLAATLDAERHEDQQSRRIRGTAQDEGARQRQADRGDVLLLRRLIGLERATCWRGVGMKLGTRRKRRRGVNACWRRCLRGAEFGHDVCCSKKVPPRARRRGNPKVKRRWLQVSF